MFIFSFNDNIYNKITWTDINIAVSVLGTQYELKPSIYKEFLKCDKYY